jgi:hypothetical protein
MYHIRQVLDGLMSVMFLISRPSLVQSIILWKVCVALDSPKGVNKYSNKPNGIMIAVFGMSLVTTGIW